MHLVKKYKLKRDAQTKARQLKREGDKTKIVEEITLGGRLYCLYVK